jgi:signal peptidase I
VTDLGGRKKRIVLALLALAGLLAIALSVALVFFIAIADVVGDDMLPTLGNSARVIVARRAQPQRGDLILFRRDGRVTIRRVIGLPGERVEFGSHEVTVNGGPGHYQPVRDLQLYGRTMKVVRERVAGVEHEVVDDPHRTLRSVPTIEAAAGYVVMADLREHAQDSRSYGAVAEDTIVGVVVHIWKPGTIPGVVSPTR